jgi:hypothetical protein
MPAPIIVHTPGRSPELVAGNTRTFHAMVQAGARPHAYHFHYDPEQRYTEQDQLEAFGFVRGLFSPQKKTTAAAPPETPLERIAREMKRSQKRRKDLEARDKNVARLTGIPQRTPLALRKRPPATDR